MILNNLFLFILPDFCTRVFRLIWTRHTRIDWSIWNGKKCPLLAARCCVCFDTSPLRREVNRKRSMRLSMDISSKTLVFFAFSSVDRHWMRKKRNTSWCNFQWTGDKKGKKRFFTSECQLGEAERIKNRFYMVNWTQIYLILNESQNISVHSFAPHHRRVSFAADRFVITAYTASWSQFTRAHPSSSHKLFILPCRKRDERKIICFSFEIIRNRRELGLMLLW